MSVHGRNFRRRVIGFLVILLFASSSFAFLAAQLPASAAPNLSFKWSKPLGNHAKAFITPLAADLVGDSDPEIVIIGGTIDGGSDGTVTVLNGDNRAIVWQRTFPLTVGGYSFGVGMHTCFEIADLYNDGKYKIIVAAEGGLLVLNGNDGSLNWSNPAAPGRQNYLAIVDVDGDGYKEIFVNRGNAPYPGWLGYDWITMLSYDGTILRQSYSWHPCWGGLTVGDTNNDGKFELYQGDRDNSYSNSADQFKEGGQGLRALDALTLTPLWTDQNILMSSHAPMLADVDKDGIQDVVVAWQSDGIAVFNSSDGSVLTTGGKYRASSSISGVDAHSQPTVADLDNDGNLEFVVAYNSQPVVWDLYDWRQDARLVNETGGAIEVFEPPKAGDVTGDGLLDIIAVTVPGDIYIYNQSYSLVEHVKQPGFYGGSAMTIVQDVDGDGRNELIVTSSQGVTLCYDTPAPTPNPKPRTDKSFYSEARRGAAEYVPAPIPVSPTLNLEWPVNSATNQVRNPTLSVKVADFQQNPMTITFSSNASGSWTTIGTRSGGNNVYSVATSGMNQYGRKYYWRVTASDGSHSTTETYSFTTLSTPPTQNTPSLIVNGGSLVASNVSTTDANGDAVDNIYSWYVDGDPYSNLYLPFDTRDSSNPMVTETVFSDGFESGWGNWASYDSWTRVTSQRYSEPYSAYAGESATYLTSNNIDISAGEGLTVSFWYRDDGIDDDDNVYLQFWNGTTYHNIFELGNTAPEDTWHFYSAQTFRATFNRPDFHFRFSASSIDAGEGLWIDDLSIVVPLRTKDYSGYANDATIHGAQWTSDGVVGGAYVFDGRTDYMRIPDVSSLDGDGSWNELSIEFWVKPLSEARGARIIAKKVAADSTGDYMVGFQTSGSPTNTLFFGVYNGSSWQDTWSDTNTRLLAGNWYHVVCTYESGPGLKIYINGTLRNSKALTGPVFNDDASESVFGSPLFIGQDGSGDQSRRYFNGVLDEVKIYRRALSADQIMQDYVEAGNGQSSHATIVPLETVQGEVWRCGVTPNDSFGDGSTVLSNPVTVGAPPAQYGLLVKVGDSGGGITNATGTTMYPVGTTVNVLATPNPNWVLSKWLLNGTDMGATPNPFSVTMSENRNLTAVFAEKPKFNLLVEVSGSGTTNATGTTLYDSGTVVAVQATPGSGWTLNHWLLNGTNVGSVNPYSVTMTENRNLTAVFTNANPVIVYVHVWGYPGGLLDPGGSINRGESVRIFAGVMDAETPSDQLNVTISYKAQSDLVWTTVSAQWEPLYGGYWYYDWTIPGSTSLGLYDVQVEASDGHGGSALVTEYGEFTVNNMNPVVNYIHVWGYPGGLLDPAGTIKRGDAVRIFTAITDFETVSNQLNLTIKYKAQTDPEWTTIIAQWESLYGGYWYYDWVIPANASLGLYDVRVEVYDGNGGFASATEYGEFNVTDANPVVNYIHVWGYPGGLLDPAGTIKPGESVRIFTGVTDLETPSNQLNVTISYKAQSDLVWTTVSAQWEPLYGGYWYHDWIIPGGASLGLYDVRVEASDGNGGSVSVTEYGEFTVT